MLQFRLEYFGELFIEKEKLVNWQAQSAKWFRYPTVCPKVSLTPMYALCSCGILAKSFFLPLDNLFLVTINCASSCVQG